MNTNSALGQKLIKDKAGTLEFFPPVAHGLASAATITIKKPGGVDLATAVDGEAMTIDAVDTTLSANPARGATQVTLTATTNVTVGFPYVITTNGQRERVTVIAVDTGTKIVTLKDELHVDHESASTFKGIRLSYSLALGQQDETDRNLLATVEYTDEGGTARFAQFTYHVVHREFIPATTEEDVLRGWGDIRARDSLRDISISDYMEDATEYIVLNVIRPIGYIEDRFFDMAAFKRIHVYTVRALVAENIYADDADRLESIAGMWWEKGEQERDRLLRFLPPYDADDDGVIDVSTEEGIAEGRGPYLPRSRATSNPDGNDPDDFMPTFRKIAAGEDFLKYEW